MGQYNLAVKSVSDLFDLNPHLCVCARTSICMYSFGKWFPSSESLPSPLSVYTRSKCFHKPSVFFLEQV